MGEENEEEDREKEDKESVDQEVAVVFVEVGKIEEVLRNCVAYKGSPRTLADSLLPSEGGRRRCQADRESQMP